MILRRAIESFFHGPRYSAGRLKQPDPAKHHIATLELENLILVKAIGDRRPFRLRLKGVNPSGSHQEIAYHFCNIGLGVGDIWVDPGGNSRCFEVYATGDLDLELFETEALQLQWLDRNWLSVWPKCLEAAQNHQMAYEKPITNVVSEEAVWISPPGDYIDHETNWWTFSFRSSGVVTVSFDETLEIQDVGVAF